METRLPGSTKDRVRAIWPNDKAHAAKQIVCWVDTNVFSHDLNAQVDYAISVGMIAERLKDAGANAFIAEVEDLLSNA